VESHEGESHHIHYNVVVDGNHVAVRETHRRAMRLH
jgi:hypothetical protein